MAERGAEKASGTSRAKAAGKRRGTLKSTSGEVPLRTRLQQSEARYSELEIECKRLRADILAARSRIGALETRQNEVLNRIDWAIDSLQNVLDEEN